MTKGFAMVLAIVALASCRSEYPSRDWSGNYLTRMIASSSDCTETPLPPPLASFGLHLEQEASNRVTVMMNPVIALEGAFEGDRLQARSLFVGELTLPDTLRQRLGPADSFDIIAYDLDANFKGHGFRATYHIRTPDIRALVRGEGPLRCSYRYELAGARFEPPPLSEQPWTRELAPADTAAAPPDATLPPAGSP